jgi:predicted O-methyltransferase YrrM
MLSGRYQGRLLAWLSALVQPKRILEIGTFTGYSALCLAEGLIEGGELHTIDRDARLTDDVQSFFDRSPYLGRIHFHIGQAADVIPTLPGPFDVVFIDAEKRAYGDYIEAIYPLTRPGTVVLIDNVLWKGKVYDSEAELDAIGTYLKAFNVAISQNARFQSIMLPVRDGLWALRVR